uniref:Uncharacterized protein n=1 Tax=Parascaris univalens TaxID=6257 RepID=A0A915BEB4_PARUN
MDSGRCTNRERVELIQATDSLSTVPPNTILSFASSKMSRQPIRVAKPPQPRTQRFPQSQGNSYNDIVRMAEQQRRLIDANRREIEEREARPPRIENPASRLAALRNEVLLEEREMARLNAIQREAREACTQRVAAEKQLYDLQNSFSSQEEQLRNAASRIDSLKTQLDLLYRRRLSAMNAARAQQKRLSAQNAQNRSLKNDEAPRPNNSNDIGVSRPRASVEPFQIARPTVVVTKEEKRRIDSTVIPPAPPLPPSQIVRNILSPSKDLTDRETNFVGAEDG